MGSWVTIPSNRGADPIAAILLAVIFGAGVGGGSDVAITALRVDAEQVRALKAQCMGASEIAKALKIGRANVYRAFEGGGRHRPVSAPRRVDGSAGTDSSRTPCDVLGLDVAGGTIVRDLGDMGAGAVSWGAAAGDSRRPTVRPEGHDPNVAS